MEKKPVAADNHKDVLQENVCKSIITNTGKPFS